MNRSSIDPYEIHLPFSETLEYLIFKIISGIVILLLFSFFIYFIVILLIVYFTTPHVQENARYLLFAHMLINDALHFIIGLFLAKFYIHFVYMPVHYCFILVTLGATTFLVTPYNLAIMALERYIAICFPLRHATLCTSQRSYFVIAVMWFLGLFPNVADLFVLVVSAENNFFYYYIICRQQALVVHPVQTGIRSVFYISSLILVVLVILFTYVRVFSIARKTKSKSSSASKASRTLMLHAVQLLLCLLSLTSSFIELYNGEYLTVLITFNFVAFMCVPRLLSPLIYGIRDELFSKSIKKLYASKQ